MDLKCQQKKNGDEPSEEAIYTWGLIAPKTIWPFIPVRESGACSLFHVKDYLGSP